MFAALILALMLGWAPVEPAGAAPRLVERFREACVATDMRRDAFDTAFADRYEQLLQVVPAGERQDPRLWMTAYGDQGVQVAMSGERSELPKATDCGVLDPTPDAGWRDDVARLADELGMQSVTVEADPDVIETRSWSRSGDDSLILVYDVYATEVVLSFVRKAGS